MFTISTRIDEEILKEIEEMINENGIDRSDAIRQLLKMGIKEYKLKKALDSLRARKITLWKAAEIAGMTYREMLNKLKEYNIPFPLSKESLSAEFEESSDK
jgi:metal-responsive CopG/Arc/MetJ family transcriptional regulator